MKPNFTDERGTITDLFVNDDMSVTEITFTEGAVRGNHYHKVTSQYDFIMEGELLCRTGEIEKRLLHQGDVMTLLAGTPHAYVAIKPSRIISVCFGVRKGTDYEKDVIRLKEEDKLIK